MVLNEWEGRGGGGLRAAREEWRDTVRVGRGDMLFLYRCQARILTIRSEINGWQ
jgi:hypothetical protein